MENTSCSWRSKLNNIILLISLSYLLGSKSDAVLQTQLDSTVNFMQCRYMLLRNYASLWFKSVALGWGVGPCKINALFRLPGMFIFGTSSRYRRVTVSQVGTYTLSQNSSLSILIPQKWRSYEYVQSVTSTIWETFPTVNLVRFPTLSETSLKQYYSAGQLTKRTLSDTTSEPDSYAHDQRRQVESQSVQQTSINMRTAPPDEAIEFG